VFLRRRSADDESSAPAISPSSGGAAVGVTITEQQREGEGSSKVDDDRSEESDMDAPDESLGPIAQLKKQYEAVSVRCMLTSRCSKRESEGLHALQAL
jgi:hypothetical protein